MKRFHAFCTRYNIASPFPVTEYLLCSFASYLANEGLSPQTGKTYLAGIRNMQLSLGLPDPRDKSSLPVLKRVQAGISRVRLQRGASAKIRLPITPQLLRRIRQRLDTTTHPNRQLIWAVCCAAFFGFFRLGELLLESQSTFAQNIHLAWGDVAVDDPGNPKMLRFHLKQSKADQFGTGVDVVLGRTYSDICPVAAVLGYFTGRGDRSGPLFVDSAGKPLLKHTFVGEIRKVLITLGVPQDQYAGHSFRIGAATTAALAGVEDSTIQLLGRWHSAAFLRYVRTPPEQLARLSSVLAASSDGQSVTNSLDTCRS